MGEKYWRAISPLPLMIDFNCYLGSYLFRDIKEVNPSRLVRTLKRSGIKKAVVSSLESLFTRNYHQSNKNIAQATQRFHNFLIPFATINPAFPGWEEDLILCRDKLFLKGIRLFPSYHHYDLSLKPLKDFLEKTSSFPLIITLRLGDLRNEHWLLNLKPFCIKEILSLRKSFSRAPTIISNATGKEILSIISQAKRSENLFFDTSFIEGEGIIENIVERLGGQRLLFGTNFPFFYPKANLEKIEKANLTVREKENIITKNGLAILKGLYRSSHST